MPLASLVALIIAVISLLLGFYNAWRQTLAERVRIKVVPIQVYVLENQGVATTSNWNFHSQATSDTLVPTLGIQVTNLSRFPIWIDELGLTLKDSQNRVPIYAPSIRVNGESNPVSFPIKMESRESSKFFADFETTAVMLEPGNIVKAYVGTSCGRWSRGTSPALDRLKVVYQNLPAS